MRLMNRYVKHFLILLALFMQTVSAQSVANPKVTYFHNDITGTAVAATDEKGEVIWREQRRAYGEIKVDPLKPRNLDEFSVGYTGHQADKESGLTYAKARYYNKEVGRFYAPDPIPFRESDLVSINRYAYAGNNPYKYVDPTGEFFWFIIPAVAMYAGTSIQYANAPGPNDKIYGVTGLDEMTDEVISAHVPEEIRTTYDVVSTVTNVAKAAKGLDNVVNNIDADDAAKKITTKNEETVSIFKAPAPGKGAGQFKNGYKKKDFCEGDQCAYFAKEKGLSDEFAEHYGEGVIELKIPKNTYNLRLKQYEYNYQGGPYKELPIPHSEFDVLNEAERIWHK